MPYCGSRALCHWSSQGNNSSTPVSNGSRRSSDTLVGAHPFVIGDSLRLLQVVRASPADRRGSIGIAVAVGIADETLFRHIQFAAQPPEGRLQKILGLVFRRDGDVADLLLLQRLGFHGGQPIRVAFGQLRPGINRIFLALFGPGIFPDLAFAQTTRFVAEHWQKRHGFRFHQFHHQFGQIVVGPIAIKIGHGHEFRIVASLVGEVGARG